MKRTLFSLACLFATASASANTITSEVNILNTDPGSVQYLNFDVTVTGLFQIDAEGSDTLGSAYNGDPQIHLFQGSLTLANLLESDDDDGFGLNSLITRNLSVGSYILAISEFSFTSDEAISGLNASSVSDPDPIRVTIGSRDGSVNFTNQVPEPATLGLLGLGLLGLAASRRKA